jgi:UTP:GlnB (protein PII) uridylyltransferase
MKEKMTKTNMTKSTKSTKSTKPSRSNQPLWERIVRRVKSDAKGGKPGQWSARKAQLVVLLYKQQGGKYLTKKDSRNSLAKWTRQQWTTWNHQPSNQKLRYLPKKAWSKLSKQQIIATNRAKRRSTSQYSKQPAPIAKITRQFRL